MTTDRSRGEVHLGDLFRALDTLPWRDQTDAATIAACLGFGLRAQPTSAPTAIPHRVYDPRTTLAPQQAEQTPAAQPPVYVPPEPQRPAPLPEGTLPSWLSGPHTVASPHEDPPGWLAQLALGGADGYPPEHEGPRLARATLLPERTARHVLSAAMATRRLGGAVHLPRLIEALCRRETLRELPRRVEATLQLGCQVLLDYSSAMVPFWEDLNALADQVREVVGEQSTRVYSFDTRPGQARHWPPGGEPEPWSPDGRPVLVATDLGIQGWAPARPSPDWEVFATGCARRGSPLILLIPWPEDRWPRTFPANATLVHWGPRTTAGMLRRQSAMLGDRR